MSTRVIPWGSIAQLHNTVKTLNYRNEKEQMPLPRIRYRAKIKIHGTNAAVQCTADGIVPQSRRLLLTPGSGDNKGFAKWAEENLAYFEGLAPGITIFGEWCGKGIEKGMAISNLDRKIFAVFAIQIGLGEAAVLEVEPEKIKAQLPDHGDIHVIPWYGEAISLNYATDLTPAVNQLNQMVSIVENEDPFVKSIFGLSGLGEGIVLYPMLEEVLTPTLFTELAFKAKGEKHRTVTTKKAVQVDPEAAKNTAEFTELVVTEARLQQGVSEVCGGVFNLTHMGELLRWINADVRKECQAELDESGLSWEKVSKSISMRCKKWYKDRIGLNQE